MFTEVQIFLTSAVVALFVTLVISALQIAGIINVKVARICLFIAWIVAVLGATASLNEAPISHRVITAVVVGISVGLILIGIERLIVRAVKNKETVLAPETKVEEKPEPNIVCLSNDDLYMTLEKNKVFREAERRTPGALRAAVVSFANEPKLGHKVASVENVRAQIIFYHYDSPDYEHHRVHYGCWLNEESPYVSFNLSDNSIHKLIVGVFEAKRVGSTDEKGFIIYSNNPDRNIPLSQTLEHNDGFWVKVRLVVGEHGEYSSEYYFYLQIKPNQYQSFMYYSDEDKKLKRVNVEQDFSNLIKRGEEFLIKFVDSDEYYSGLESWRDEISEWLTKNFGLYVSWRFYGVVDIEKLKRFPLYSPGGHNQALDEFYTQLLSLKEINEDYKASKILLPFDL